MSQATPAATGSSTRASSATGSPARVAIASIRLRCPPSHIAGQPSRTWRGPPKATPAARARTTVSRSTAAIASSAWTSTTRSGPESGDATSVNVSERLVIARLTERITCSGLTMSASSPTNSAEPSTSTTDGSQFVERPSGRIVAGEAAARSATNVVAVPKSTPMTPMTVLFTARHRCQSRPIPADSPPHPATRPVPCRAVHPLHRSASYSPAG